MHCAIKSSKTVEGPRRSKGLLGGAFSSMPMLDPQPETGARRSHRSPGEFHALWSGAQARATGGTLRHTSVRTSEVANKSAKRATLRPEPGRVI